MIIIVEAYFYHYKYNIYTNIGVTVKKKNDHVI